MNLSQKLFVARKLAIVTLFSMFVQLVTPVAAFALTSGPSAPEFSSFEPVATNNMVDLFSGDFTYNIPVLDIPGAHGGGYAMSLSYHSGASLEEEASWVGYGWTLNPGAINHGKQGFSDDWNGVTINYYNKTKPNKTVNIFGSAGIEAFSQDFSAEDLPFNLGGFSLGAGISYNNYKGYRWNVDIGANIGGGTISLGYNINNSGDYPFRLDISPMALLSFATMSLKKKEEQKKAAKKAKAAKDEKMEALNKSTDFLKNSASTGGPSSFASGYGLHDLNIERAFPKGTNNYSGFRVSIEASLLSTPAGLPLGFTAGLSGAYNKQISNNSQGKAFGYMNTHNSMENDVLKDYAQQDYRVENRDAVFDNKTPFIGIPINDADNYIVTGEGTMGGFRCYNRSGMTFKPEKIINTTLLFNGGVDVTTGVSFGVGTSLASGDHTLKTDTWDVVGTIPWNNNTPSTNADGREPYFFRFDSDMADGVFCKESPPQIAATSNPNFATQSINFFNGNVTNIGQERYGINSTTLPDNNKRVKRSSFIDYNTFADGKKTVVTTGVAAVNPYLYGKDPITATYMSSATAINETNKPTDNQIREFSTINKDGMTYTYGLPVFARNEVNIAYNASAIGTDYSTNGATIYGDSKQSTAYSTDDGLTLTDDPDATPPETQIGQATAAPYATNYLLTTITTPDYQDRTNDGPTDDDFGGYTRFVYDKAYGYGEAGWYNWRTPYSGFLYDKNSIHNPNDDMAGANWGEKEVYYLRYIETKTHVAVFDLSARVDGKGACAPADADIYNGCSSTQLLYQLDKVTLFAKKNTLDWSHSNKLNNLLSSSITTTFSDAVLATLGAGGEKMFEPIKSVNFAYDNSLCTGLPNSTESGGKLTLKKVWFEYKNIPTTTISPYEFAYNYPNNDAVFLSINPTYSFGNYGNTAGIEQNPTYNATALDSWQNYRADGVNRQTNMQPWVDQTPIGGFDPAAWQLKKITLPSGGQILVQYEQDDYSYVQDKLAHAMVSCNGGDMNVIDDNMEVTLDLSELGTDIDKEYLLSLIKKEYLTEQAVQVIQEPPVGGVSTPSTEYETKRIYFKFLYNLLEGNCNLNCRLNEYIDGYAHLSNAEISVNNIKLIFDDNPMAGLCNDFFQAEANQKLTNTTSADCDDNPDILANITSIPDAAQALVDVITNAANAMSGTCGNPCPANSYVRIPIPNKKGGGLRVKRLLTYDPNVGATGSESVFGSEYIYKTTSSYTNMNGNVNNKLISSGVATNEPSGAREENILVDFMPRFKQNWFKKLVGGEDKEVLEGPLGESLLPPPSVGYSQVIVRNIHGGVTNPGFSVNTYYTAKEFPFKSEMSNLDIASTYVPIYAGLFNMVQDSRWLAQGFRFLINEMHGKAHTTTSYSNSTYVPSIEDDGQVTLANKLVGNVLGEVVTSTEYEYFEPGSQLPTITAQSATDPRATNYFDNVNNVTWDGQLHQAISMMPLGQEVDVTTEDKKIVDEFENLGVEFDASLVLLGLIPIPLPTVCPEVTFNKSQLRTHATTKVIHYPAVLKKVKTMANGLSSVTENYLFNRETGDPIVTLTYVPNTIGSDAINPSQVPFTDRGYVNYNFPASMQYANMSQKAKNARAVFKDVIVNNITGGRKITITNLSNIYQKYFSKGDLIGIKQGGNVRYGTVSSIAADGITIVRTYLSQLPAIDTDLAITTNIEIIRSGNTNQLSTMAGNFTAYKIGNLDGTGDHTTPPAAISTEWSSTLPSYLQIPQNEAVLSYAVPNVVSASAAVFSDNATIGNNTYSLTDANSWYYNEPYEHYYPYATNMNPCSYGTNYNLYQLNKRGKWRLHSTFAYEAKNGTSGSLLSLSNSYNNQMNYTLSNNSDYADYVGVYNNTYSGTLNCTDKNYEAGTYTLGIFDWRNTNANVFNTSTGRWLRTNLITKYSPHGDPLEESNILGIKSCAKYGYNKTLPYLTAQNAEYNSVYFESFENVYNYNGDNCAAGTTGNNCVEDESVIPNSTAVNITYKNAHSGHSCWTTAYNDNGSLALGDFTANVSNNTYVPSKTYSIKFWLKHSSSVNLSQQSLSLYYNGQTIYQITNNNPIATSGDWDLYATTLTTTAAAPLAIKFAGRYVLVDDIRIQPIDAQMNCYVYDNKTQQLLTTFDDQHFGTYYQYNEKGQLVRKIIETERGKKTVQENQYNTPKKTKP